MNFKLLISIIIIIFSLFITVDTYIILDDAKTFNQFRKEYQKTYHDYYQTFYRFKVFQTNLRFIQELNANQQGTAVYGVNFLADLTRDQIKQMYASVRIDPQYEIKYAANYTNEIEYKPRQDTPDIWNWAQQGGVTQVKNQGSCGSCWAFSTAQNIQGQYWMRQNKLIGFSQQQLVDCDKSNFGCSGGWPYMAIDWLANNGGIETMADYPTRANYSGPCQFDPSKAKTKIKGYLNITKNETIIKDALYQLGPLSILLDFTGLTYYKGGIASPLFCYTWPDHALLLVGYGIQNGDYWLIKNSWGTKWGENGYLKLHRGKDKCGIADWATTAILADQSEIK